MLWYRPVHMRRALSVLVVFLVVAVAWAPVCAVGRDVAWEASRTFMLALLNGSPSVEPSVSSLTLPEARQWLDREVPGKTPFVSFRLVGVDRKEGGFLGRVRLLRDGRLDVIYLEVNANGRVTALLGLSDLIAASERVLRDAMVETEEGLEKRAETSSEGPLLALLTRHRVAAAEHLEVIERHIRTLRGE